jgi:hypothetical protein
MLKISGGVQKRVKKGFWDLRKMKMYGFHLTKTVRIPGQKKIEVKIIKNNLNNFPTP